MPKMARRAATLVIAIGLAAVAAAPAAAASLPLRADVRAGRQVDVDAFERSVAIRYHLHFRKVVAADIDRDGDIDVVAATDLGLIVWVNDGEGHLTSQPPANAAVVDGRFNGPALGGRETNADEPIQDDLPSVPLPAAS